ncbi:MAG TPA: hypothetical protein VGR55_02970 [Candidatus Acidoferrum sp.]|nr:hypothetical protein [Candidatus Acidoferrum sp.]
MLTRPGSEPGPAWMRELALNPRRLRKAILCIVIFFGLIQVMFIVLGDIAAYRAHGRHVRAYTSQTQIMGMPLLSMGGRAHGVIAYGGLATGIVAIGGVAAGVIAFGGVSVGLLGFGGLTIGLIVLGAGAIGWRAMGAVAIGIAAFGALAIGRYAYAGPGVAMGRDEASGQQKESLFG